MQKIVIHRPGSYDQLRLETHTDPTPGAGEILIQVQAAGINYADCVIRMGLYESAKKYVGYPITPGFEVAGSVAALGKGAAGFEVGQPVVAATRFGGYASWVAVPAQLVFPLPDRLTPEQAAGFPSVFLTAWFALHELAHPRTGDTALVHSAAGGVGSALLQLCRDANIRTIGVVGAAHKVEAAKRLGADEVIDKSAVALWAEVERLCPEGPDIIFDANGVATLQQGYQHLAPVGRLIVYGFHSMLPRTGGRPRPLRLARDYLRTPRFNPFRMTGDNKSVLAFNLSYLFERTDILLPAMRQLFDRVADGRIVPPKTTAYPLAEVAQAHRDLESGQTVGKLVLTMPGE